MSAHEEGSKKAIIAAASANLGIALAKAVAFTFTGSSSMLAEAIHSAADTGNQLLLMRGRKRSQKEASKHHSFGYARERYVYSFLVAVTIFTAGGLFALYEGVEKVLHPHQVENWGWAVGVLIISLGLEGFSFRTAMAETREMLGKHSFWGFIRHTKAPELPVVLLEDSGALVGLVLALLGVSLAVLTGSGLWDGIGTLAIGVLLVGVASILAVETKSLLVGESASEEDVARVVAALEEDERITEVVHVRTQHLGPSELMVVVKVVFTDDMLPSELARHINVVEASIRSSIPEVGLLYIEPGVPSSQWESTS